MPRLSFFAPPKDGFQTGGAHIAVHIVPVFENRLVAFDVDAPGVTGRFLPWTVLAFGGNPYMDASLLVDDWCQGAVASLQLVDVIGGHQAEGSQELAIVFRAELTAAPEGDEHRTPIHIDVEKLEPVRSFAVAELRRWLDVPDEVVPVAEEAPPFEEWPARDDDRPKLVF